ncbi:hypothetical protein EsH8_IV_000305 [Colletotrichum jinshuiense]
MPAHTLPILGRKLYVVSSPYLAAAVMRKRTLSFAPLLANFTNIMLGLDGPGLDMWKGPDFHAAYFRVLYKGLGGESLANLTTALVGNTTNILSRMPHSDVDVTNFYEWIREVLTAATTAALYGSKNPLKEPKMIETFWTFHDGMHRFLIPAAPSIVAPTAYKARYEVQEGIEAYITMENEMADDVPQFTRDRIGIGKKFGLCANDISKIEFGFAIASLANTTALLYWFLSHIYSQPGLLANIREELLNVVEEHQARQPELAERQMTLHLGGIKDRCPLFFSCFQETQRLTAVDNVNRVVTADTTLTEGDRTFVLKKGQHLQVPLAILHRDPEVWGEAPETWISDRFLKMGEKAVSQTGFFPFGGGKHQW